MNRIGYPDPESYYDDDDEEIIQYLEHLSTPRVTRRVLSRTNFFETMREDEFVRRFRLSKRTVAGILDKILPHLEHRTNRNNAVSPMNQLLCALRFYATGSQLITCGDFIKMHESTACRIIQRVTHALASLRPEYVKFPESITEIEATKRKFYQLAKFPNVMGAIDCTHVKIQSPGGENSELFRNRKGYFSMNVQCIGNADLFITDIVARWYGSAHDSTIWNNCKQRRDFQCGFRGDGLLVGDSGYAVKPYMMTPLDPNRVTTPEERLYNASQIKTRNVIERIFGVWKRRFPILSRGIQLSLRRVPGVIVATAVLHNIARMANEESPPEDPDFPSNNTNMPTTSVESDTSDGKRRRTLLIENYFKSLL